MISKQQNERLVCFFFGGYGGFWDCGSFILRTPRRSINVSMLDRRWFCAGSGFHVGWLGIDWA